MKEQAVNAVVSSLPIAIILAPLAAAALVLAGRQLGRLFWQGATLLGSAINLAIGLAIVREVLDGKVLTAWGNQLRVDGLSALMVALLGVIGFIATLYSLRYMAREDTEHAQADDVARRRLWTYYWLLSLFIGTMQWGSVTNNVIVLYVAVEATTLASGLLVSFYWDKRALEAGYKYMILLTVGLTFALFGCVLIYAASAATGRVSGSSALLLSELRGVGHLVPAPP